MSDQPMWIANEESMCLLKWTDYLHSEAQRLFNQDGTHGNMLFSFKKEEGLVSVNLIPPNIDHDQLDEAITNTVNEHSLYGVVVIGETWMYSLKEKDHTTFQLLDGEMKVSDLNDEDKKEALMIRMENRDGDCLIYLDEITRNKNGHALNENKIIRSAQRKWFIDQSHN